MKEEKKGVKMKPLKMTMHGAEDLVGRVKIKTFVKEAYSELRLKNNEEMVNDGRKPVMGDNSSSKESSDEESKPVTSETEQIRNRIYPKTRHKILPSKNYPCKNCTNSYDNKTVWLKHMYKTHNTPYQCEKCDHQFTDYLHLKRHGTKNHPSFICSICGVAKLLRNQLTIHIEGEHQDNIQCPHCKLMFKTRSILNNHINRSHSKRVYENV
jgi:rubrerythrin